MARPRHVAWRSVGRTDHCWVIGKTTSLCGRLALRDSGLMIGARECRRCRAALEELA